MSALRINPFTIVLFISAAISLIAAGYVWRRRPAPGATPLAIFLLGATLWSGGHALEIASTTMAGKLFWARIAYIGIVVAPTMLLLMVLQYTGKDGKLKRKHYLLLAIEPATTLILFWTNPAHGLIWKTWELVDAGIVISIEKSYGIGFIIHTVYSYLVLIAGLYLLVQTYRHASAVLRSQTRMILVGTLIPWVANALYIFKINPFPQMDLTSLAFTLTGLITAWTLFRFELFNITPVAREIIIESLSDGVIVLDPEARVVDINPAALEIISQSKEQIIGRPLREALSEWPELVRTFKDVTQINTQLSFLVGDTEYYFNLRISPIYDRRQRLVGRTIMLQDVTESRLAQEQLRRLSQAVEQSANIIMITDREGEIKYVNPAFTEITGYTAEEAVGANPRILKSGKMPPKTYEVMWKTLVQGGVWHGELINKKKNGDLYWETASISPVKNQQGEITHYVAVKDDITQRKHMEEELVITRDKALEASRLKSQILTNVSHDMRTPLGAIVGYTEMLQNEIYGPINEQQKEKLDVLLQSANQLIDFVVNLLGQSEIASGELSIQRQSVSPRKLIEEMQSVTRVLAERKGILLTSEIAPDLPERLIGDNYWIQRILTNLVSNAVKFTETGQIQVRAYLARQDQWAIQVRDTGIGIPLEAQEYIFEPFRKVDDIANGPHSSGTGLGLAIVKEVVSRMDGEITLESGPGKGSIFTIYLPLEKANGE
jgi:PAS domain S-box-containing protein